MKLWTTLLITLVASMSVAEDRISELSYLPSKGVFAGRTALTFTKIRSTILSLEADENQTKLTQTFDYGMTSWLVWSVITPFLINGEVIADSSTNTSIETGLERSIFGLTAHYNANERLKGIFTVQFREQGVLSSGTTTLSYGLRYKKGLSSTLFRVSFASFTDNPIVERFRIYSSDLTSQFANSAGFFIRPSLIISYESDTDYKSNDFFRLVHKVRLTSSISFGQEFKESRFYWLFGTSYGFSELDVFIASASGSGDITSFSINTEFGYKF